MAVSLERDRVRGDFTIDEILLRNVMVVPIRLTVRLEALPKDIPMSVWSNFFAISGLTYLVSRDFFFNRVLLEKANLRLFETYS